MNGLKLELMRLDRLPAGETARVVKIHGDGDSAVRLHALGILPGSRIHRRQTAPLGDPVAYDVNGQKISLRRGEASLIEVEPG